MGGRKTLAADVASRRLTAEQREFLDAHRSACRDRFQRIKRLQWEGWAWWKQMQHMFSKSVVRRK